MLESPLRRANLHIVNIPKGIRKVQEAVRIVPKMLMGIMGPDVFAKPPVITQMTELSNLGPICDNYLFALDSF